MTPKTMRISYKKVMEDYQKKLTEFELKEIKRQNNEEQLYKQIEKLKTELNKEREINHKLVKVLKRYADPNFYDVVADQLDDGEMISEDSEADLALKDISTFIGSIPVGCLARKTLKEVGEEE